jgi:hypothetical protein
VFLLGEREHCFNSEMYISSLKKPPQPHLLLQNIKDTIQWQYGQTFTSMLRLATKAAWSALVSTSLFRWNVTRDDKFGDRTIAELESAGILFVEQTNEPTSFVAEYTIVFPLLLLLHLVLNGDKEVDVPMLLRNFTVMLSPNENEHCTLAIFALKCEALHVMEKPITIQALFPGYAAQLDWRDEAMLFDGFRMRTFATQVTMKTWATDLSSVKTTGGFLVNASGAPFCDMMIIPRGGERVILIQEKQEQVAKTAALETTPDGKRKRMPSFNVSRVVNEHAKCNVKTNHLFVMVTDADFTDSDKLENNEIVLPGRDHKNAIGPLLALLRLHNHFHRQKFKP